MARQCRPVHPLQRRVWCIRTHTHIHTQTTIHRNYSHTRRNYYTHPPTHHTHKLRTHSTHPHISTPTPHASSYTQKLQKLLCIETIYWKFTSFTRRQLRKQNVFTAFMKRIRAYLTLTILYFCWLIHQISFT